MDYQKIIKKLKSISNRKNLKGMARFGINTRLALGIPVTQIRKLAKEILKTNDLKRNPVKRHELAQKLWKSKIHEARILASIIDVKEKVTKSQMDSWIKDFNSWDLCDQVCANLFDKTPFAFEKAIVWTKRKKEFERRAGYTLMACLAWHDKNSPDSKFIRFFPYIKEGATDDRNFVKKAINWAIRQIGKRNKNLNKKSIKLSQEILKIDNKTAKWIAKDALKELQSEKVLKRIS